MGPETQQRSLTYLPKRIRNKIHLTDKCWQWIAATSHDGYAIVSWNGQSVLAARVVYTLLRGPIPKGLEPDHLCRNRACVNPDCVEIVTHKINTLRGNTVGGVNSRKTCCPKGHPFTETNTIIDKGKYGPVRRCKICRTPQVNEAKKRYRVRHAI